MDIDKTQHRLQGLHRTQRDRVDTLIDIMVELLEFVGKLVASQAVLEHRQRRAVRALEELEPPAARIGVEFLTAKVGPPQWRCTCGATSPDADGMLEHLRRSHGIQ